MSATHIRPAIEESFGAFVWAHQVKILIEPVSNFPVYPRKKNSVTELSPDSVSSFVEFGWPEF